MRRSPITPSYTFTVDWLGDNPVQRPAVTISVWSGRNPSPWAHAMAAVCRPVHPGLSSLRPSSAGLRFSLLIRLPRRALGGGRAFCWLAGAMAISCFFCAYAADAGAQMTAAIYVLYSAKACCSWRICTKRVPAPRPCGLIEGDFMRRIFGRSPSQNVAFIGRSCVRADQDWKQPDR